MINKQHKENSLNNELLNYLSILKNIQENKICKLFVFIKK